MDTGKRTLAHQRLRKTEKIEEKWYHRGAKKVYRISILNYIILYYIYIILIGNLIE